MFYYSGIAILIIYFEFRIVFFFPPALLPTQVLDKPAQTPYQSLTVPAVCWFSGNNGGEFGRLYDRWRAWGAFMHRDPRRIIDCGVAIADLGQVCSRVIDGAQRIFNCFRLDLCFAMACVLCFTSSV